MIKGIIERCAALNVYEKRAASAEYFEVVFYSQDEQEWVKALTAFFGSVAKLPRVKPLQEDLSLTKDCGGIFVNQTLFNKKCEGFTVIAMFWPWGDGAHTTLKVVMLKV